jgi:hypothetical protein
MSQRARTGPYLETWQNKMQNSALKACAPVWAPHCIPEKHEPYTVSLALVLLCTYVRYITSPAQLLSLAFTSLELSLS